MTAKPVTNKNIMLKNGFWKEMAELVKNEVISYQWNALNDNIENAEKVTASEILSLQEI